MGVVEFCKRLADGRTLVSCGNMVALEGLAGTRVLNGSTASSGDTTLLTPSAGRQLVVGAFILQAGGSAVTAILHGGNINAGWRAVLASTGDRLAVVLPAGREWRLEALVLNLNAAQTVHYTVYYWEE